MKKIIVKNGLCYVIRETVRYRSVEIEDGSSVVAYFIKWADGQTEAGGSRYEELLGRYHM